jgi:TonB family protein
MLRALILLATASGAAGDIDMGKSSCARIGVTGSGRTAIELSVTADGRVESCRITDSSGAKPLDDAACRILGQRAKFEPGAAMVKSLGIRWCIRD